MSAIKIVATIGPRTAQAKALRELAEAGMDVARLNGSHADLGWHARVIRLLRRTVPHVPILLDIPGRKIRTGLIAGERRFEARETVVFRSSPRPAGAGIIPLTSESLHRDVRPRTVILADDGQLRFTVLRVEGADIICRADIAGTLTSGKGINVPSVTLRSSVTGPGDRRMLDLARDSGVDYVGISFVRSEDEVREVRSVIGGHGPRVVAKIETAQALDRVRHIAAAADALMIDRGDLSVETQLERIAILQKHILAAAREARCPVIVATEMLHSMIQSPTPTKAEISDISNAVLDGASALMLSGETAVGAHPARAVRTMRRAADAVWAHMHEGQDASGTPAAASIPDAMGEAVAFLCRRLPIAKIVAITISGYAARMVAAHRPRQPILAVSNDRENARAFNLLPGVRGVHVGVRFRRTTMEHVPKCLESLWRSGHLDEEDLVLVTAVGYPKSGNRMNLLETHRISDLKKALGWRGRRQKA